MRIVSIEVCKLSLPLREPYHLSYRSIHEFDSVWVRMELSNGRIGWGESTPLPGYSESDMDAVWASSNRLAAGWVGKPVDLLLSAPPRARDGFLFTSVWTALEDAAGLIPRVAGRVPLVGPVQERAGETPAVAMQRARGFGFRVFKVKAGFLTAEQDVQRLQAYQQSLQPEGESIRVDANQSLTEAEAARLLDCCNPGKIELFEQPLSVDAWDACARLARRSAVPIMLDEAITDVDSLHQAAQTGAASIVKLKWMKQGGMFFLREMVEHARRLGLRVVLGNGVAGWIDNRNEASFWLQHLQDMQLAGEMNGYLKIRSDFTPFAFVDGCMILSAKKEVDIDPGRYQLSAMQQYRA
jgi:L-Ala-D/L-Glu epimerase / N-acetyl-D-glutamate racemase